MSRQAGVHIGHSHTCQETNAHVSGDHSTSRYHSSAVFLMVKYILSFTSKHIKTKKLTQEFKVILKQKSLRERKVRAESDSGEE